MASKIQDAFATKKDKRKRAVIKTGLGITAAIGIIGKIKDIKEAPQNVKDLRKALRESAALAEKKTPVKKIRNELRADITKLANKELKKINPKAAKLNAGGKVLPHSKSFVRKSKLLKGKAFGKFAKSYSKTFITNYAKTPIGRKVGKAAVAGLALSLVTKFLQKNQNKLDSKIKGQAIAGASLAGIAGASLSIGAAKSFSGKGKPSSFKKSKSSSGFIPRGGLTGAAASKAAKSGKGRWVTIGGRRVFLKGAGKK